MSFSFNLIDQPWIPCVQPDGLVREFSLRDTFIHANELRGIQGDSPLETAALYRLLLAILHSAIRGPKSSSDWNELWQGGKGRWDKPWMHQYLDRWHDCFDLFNPEKPFFQARDERAKPKSIISLSIDMASGNMGTLFDHHIEIQGETLKASQAARVLLVAQTFGLAGLCMPGVNFTDGPWARGIIFLVEGETLFENLALNLLPYPRVKSVPTESGDCPYWERTSPFLPIRQVPEGYLDYLTWPSRKILLLPEGDEVNPVVRLMTLAPGLRLDSSMLDPMKLYRTGKDVGYLSIRFSEDRVLWRDSDSLFGLRSSRGNRPPDTFYWLADLASYGCISQQQTYRYMSLGMSNDQAKVEFFQEEHLPLPIVYLERDDLVEKLASALELAEQTRIALRRAGHWLALLVISPKSDGKKWQEVDRISRDEAEKLYSHWMIERFYWQLLDTPFRKFLEDLPVLPEASQAWVTALQRTAWHALELAVNNAGLDAGSLKAAVRARNSLGHSMNDVFSTTNKEANV